MFATEVWNSSASWISVIQIVPSSKRHWTRVWPSLVRYRTSSPPGGDVPGPSFTP